MHRVVDALRHLEELRLARRLRHRLRRAAQDARAGVVHLVDAMAEAGHARLGIRALGLRQRATGADPRLDVRLRPRRIADLAEHREDVFVGAAVPRALERRHGRRQRGVHVGQRRHRHARGERRGIELVIGVEDQPHVEHVRHLRRGRAAVEQMEKARRVAAVLRRGGPTTEDRHTPSGRVDGRAAGANALPGRDGLGHEVHEPVALAHVRLEV